MNCRRCTYLGAYVIFQILPIFVCELFETMQSSVTRSRTSISKSLPALLHSLYLSYLQRVTSKCFVSPYETLVSTVWN